VGGGREVPTAKHHNYSVRWWPSFSILLSSCFSFC